MQLTEAIGMFLDRPEIAPATRRTYRYDLRHMMRYIGDKPMGEIHPTDLLRYGNYVNKRAGIDSAHTYNKHVTTMKTFFNWCVKAQITEKSPAQILASKKVSRQVPSSKAMSDLKLTRLLEYVAESPRGWNPREEAIVRLLADTGCRIGSAANLRESDMDINQRRAIISEKGKVEKHSIRFGRECSRAISTWLLRRNTSRGNYIFSTDGSRMTNASLGQYFRRLCQRADIGSWGPHSLRHRFGHTAIKKFPISVVAKMLGDTIEVTMQHYLPQDEAYIENAMLQMTTDHLIQHDIIELDKKVR